MLKRVISVLLLNVLCIGILEIILWRIWPTVGYVRSDSIGRFEFILRNVIFSILFTIIAFSGKYKDSKGIKQGILLAVVGLPLIVSSNVDMIIYDQASGYVKELAKDNGHVDGITRIVQYVEILFGWIATAVSILVTFFFMTHPIKAEEEYSGKTKS